MGNPKKKLYDFLKSELEMIPAKDNKIESKQWRFRCINPGHEDRSPSLSINSSTGQCYCFSCPFSGNVFSLCKILGVSPKKSPFFSEGRELYHYSDGSIQVKDTEAEKKDKKWFFQQGKGCLFMDKNLTLAKKDEDKTIYLCEGATDTLALCAIGKRAVGVPGLERIEKMLNSDVLKGIENIVLCFDYDKNGAGQNKTQELIANVNVIPWGIEVSKIDWEKWTGLQEYLSKNDKIDVRAFNTFVRRRIKTKFPDLSKSELYEKTAKTFRKKIDALTEPVDREAEIYAAKPHLKTRSLKEEALDDSIKRPKFIIDKIIPPGLTLIVGDPKAGKSILAYNIARSVSQNIPLFGKFEVQRRGKVIYFALEDPAHRRKYRIRKIHGTDFDTFKDNFLTIDKWPSLSDESIADLRLLIQMNRPKLIIIDPFIDIMRFAGNGRSQPKAEYDQMIALKGLADEFKIAVVVVHHPNKSKDVPKLYRISGSLMLSAAVDNFLLLETGEVDNMDRITSNKLVLMGREVGQGEDPGIYVLNRSFKSLTWIVSKNKLLFDSAERQKTWDVLIELHGESSSEWIPLSEIAKALGKEKSNVIRTLRSMREHVIAGPRGKYRPKLNREKVEADSDYN